MKLYYNKFKGGSDYKQLDFRAAPVSNFRTNQFSEKKTKLNGSGRKTGHRQRKNNQSFNTIR